MAEKQKQQPPDASPPASPTVDRRNRRAGRPKPDPKSLGGISHDDLGNAVWEWRVSVPARRDDDPTIDLVDSLDVDGMSLEENDPTARGDDSFNPYDKTR